MALYLGRADGNGRGANRVKVEWEGGELVLEPQGDERLRVHVTVGSEREEHELDFGGGSVLQAQSKLITIEEIGKSGALERKPATHVNEQSKLIKIEDTGGSLPEVTIVL